MAIVYWSHVFFQIDLMALYGLGKDDPSVFFNFNPWLVNVVLKSGNIYGKLSEAFSTFSGFYIGPGNAGIGSRSDQYQFSEQQSLQRKTRKIQQNKS